MSDQNDIAQEQEFDEQGKGNALDILGPAPVLPPKQEKFMQKVTFAKALGKIIVGEINQWQDVHKEYFTKSIKQLVKANKLDTSDFAIELNDERGQYEIIHNLISIDTVRKFVTQVVNLMDPGGSRGYEREISKQKFVRIAIDFGDDEAAPGIGEEGLAGYFYSNGEGTFRGHRFISNVIPSGYRPKTSYFSKYMGSSPQVVQFDMSFQNGFHLLSYNVATYMPLKDGSSIPVLDICYINIVERNHRIEVRKNAFIKTKLPLDAFHEIVGPQSRQLLGVYNPKFVDKGGKKINILENDFDVIFAAFYELITEKLDPNECKWVQPLPEMGAALQHYNRATTEKSFENKKSKKDKRKRESQEASQEKKEEPAQQEVPPPEEEETPATVSEEETVPSGVEAEANE
jgi:hypothetical protein